MVSTRPSSLPAAAITSAICGTRALAWPRVIAARALARTCPSVTSAVEQAAPTHSIDNRVAI